MSKFVLGEAGFPTHAIGEWKVDKLNKKKKRGNRECAMENH